jgi:hypothetical protein
MSHEWILPLGLLLLCQLSGTGTQVTDQILPPNRGARVLAAFGLMLAALALLPFLAHQVDLAVNAIPGALSAKAVFLTLLCLVLLLLLCCSLTSLLTTVIQFTLGRDNFPRLDSPALACTLFEFWARLLPSMIQPGRAAFVQSMPALAAIAMSAALWRGSLAGSAVWLTLHCLALMLEQQLTQHLAIKPPVLVKRLWVIGFLLLTSVLWVSPDPAQARQWLMILIEDVRGSTTSLWLDKRLTLPACQLLLMTAMALALSLPALQGRWVTRACRHPRWVAALGAVCCLIALRDLLPLPAAVRQALQWPISRWMEHGNRGVHQGYDGWLFARSELDRRTQRRQQPGLLADLLKTAIELKTQGQSMMLICVPAKAALYPEQILRAEYPGPVHPPGWQQTLSALQAKGVKVLDPADSLWNRIEFEASHYSTDTRWTFESMKAVAAASAKEFKKLHPHLSSDETPLIRASVLEQVWRGNLAQSLLPLPWPEHFAWEDEQVVSIAGLPHEPDSTITLAMDRAGDCASADASTTVEAGFARHLAALLGRGIHLIDLHPIETLSKRMGKGQVLLVLSDADRL